MSDSKIETCVSCGIETGLMFQRTDCLEKVIFVRACSHECADVAFAESQCVYSFDEQGFA